MCLSVFIYFENSVKEKCLFVISLYNCKVCIYLSIYLFNHPFNYPSFICLAIHLFIYPFDWLIPAGCCRRSCAPSTRPCTAAPWTLGWTRWRRPPAREPPPWARRRTRDQCEETKTPVRWEWLMMAGRKERRGIEEKILWKSLSVIKIE